MLQNVSWLAIVPVHYDEYEPLKIKADLLSLRFLIASDSAQGRTALHEAANNGRDDCVDSLVKRDANLNAQNVSAGPVPATPPPRLCSARAATAAPPRRIGRTRR